MESLTDRLMRKIPGYVPDRMTPEKARVGIKMPSSGFYDPSVPSPAQAGPGVTPVKTVLNKPGSAGIKGVKIPKGAGKAVSRGNALAAGLGLLEMGVAATPTDYGRKVKKAGEEFQGASDSAYDYAMDAVGGLTSAIGGLFSGRKGGMPNLGADYKQQEQDMINNALMFKGQQNRKQQLEDGVIPGQLPADYKETEAKAFREAADAGDIQTDFIKSITTGTDTSTARRDAPPKELSEGMAAWAKANPGLADDLIEKVQGRRLTDPGYTQSGYGTILETMRPGARNDAFGLQSSGYDAVKQDDGTFAAPKYVEVGGRPALFKEEGEITPMTNDEIKAERKLGAESSVKSSSEDKAQALLKKKVQEVQESEGLPLK